ncbi:mucin-2-like [Melanerpes formicivorus]|uniref:mucin-2-like n=1 Tax=Melanerpes formicivorus TaxID=211600 RepID=UPI00359027E3
MECLSQWPLWSWMLWGLWVLPVPAPAELDSISPTAGSTNDNPLDLGMCQAFLTTVTTQQEPPSPTGRTTTSKGIHGSVPGTKASSSVTGKLADANGLVQQSNAMPAERTLGTTWTTVPSLLQDKRSIGTSLPSISKSSAEPRETAVLLSQEVISDLDKTTSPLSIEASISQDIVNPAKLATASASPTADVPKDVPYTVMEGARVPAPLSADPSKASLAKVAFSSATLGIREATEPGARPLSNGSYNASQNPPVPPAQSPPALSLQLPTAAVPGTGEMLPASHTSASGTSGDVLYGASTVTHSQAAALTPGTSPMAMDVTTAEHDCTTSSPALGSSNAELMSVRSEPSTRATAGATSLETEATPVELITRWSSRAASDSSGGSSAGPFVHSMGSLLLQTTSEGPGATTADTAAGKSSPGRPSVATSLSFTGTGEAKPDGAPQATAAPTPPGVYGITTQPAAHPSSRVSSGPDSEVGMGTASLASSTTTRILWDTRAAPVVPDASPSHSQPGPTAGSAPFGTGVTPGPLPAPLLQAAPQYEAASGAETQSPSSAPARISVASQADVPPLLEGSVPAGMAPSMSSFSIPYETAVGMSLLSLATPPPTDAPSDPLLDGSTTGQVVVTALEVDMEENPGTSAARPGPNHVIGSTRPSPEPSPQGTSASETRPPADLPLLAPRNSRSAPLAMAGTSPVLTTASPFPSTTTGRDQPETSQEAPQPETSQEAGGGSTTQEALGSAPVVNVRVGAVTGTPHSDDSTMGTVSPLSPPTTASFVAQPSAAAWDHSYPTADSTVGTDKGMGLDMGTASLTMGNRAAELPLGLPASMAARAEPDTGDAIPSTHSALGSKIPTAAAVMGMASPTAVEPIIALSPGRIHSTADPDVTVSPPVPGNTYPVVKALSVTLRTTITHPAVGADDASLSWVTTPLSVFPSSASSPPSPHVTLRPPPEATYTLDSTALSPVTADEPIAEATSLAVGHTSTWKTTAASQSDARGATTWEDTTPSEHSAEGAAPSASTGSTHVPISNPAGTSTATTPSASVFPSTAIPPVTSASVKTSMVTGAITAMPSAMVKATIISSVPSLAVTQKCSQAASS